jgi:dUTP pyrophosphatase
LERSPKPHDKQDTDDKPEKKVRWGFHGPLPSDGLGADVPVVEFKPRAIRAEPIGAAATRVDGGGDVALRVRRLSGRASLPAYQTAGSAGMDLAACLEPGVQMVLGPGAIVVVPTGLAVAIPEGFEGQVRPRSGLATRHGVTVVNAPGTIDSDYRGELRVALVNLGSAEFIVEHGMRIAQLVIAPMQRVRVEVVDALDETLRGAGGFGSTGMGARSPATGERPA